MTSDYPSEISFLRSSTSQSNRMRVMMMALKSDAAIPAMSVTAKPLMGPEP